jgi:hypothetical protein
MRFTSFVVIDTVYRNFLKRSWFVQGESDPYPDFLTGIRSKGGLHKTKSVSGKAADCRKRGELPDFFTKNRIARVGKFF